MVAENYPGLEISIGEYNFGGERTIAGGLALAEVLGRFGQEGVYSAYYWTFPPDNSCAYQAFRAYRNYDGAGSRFLDLALPTTGDNVTSLFASQDEGGGKLVAIALNLNALESSEANVDLIGCGEVQSGKVYQYTGDSAGIQLVDDKVTTDHGALKQKLPPYSITVFELNVDRSKHY